jgi:hypothetical protein
MLTIVQYGRNLTLRDGYRIEQNMTVELSRARTPKEAKQAFVEKRKPVFRVDETHGRIAPTRRRSGGAAMARRFAQEGARVICADINYEAAVSAPRRCSRLPKPGSPFAAMGRWGVGRGAGRRVGARRGWHDILSTMRR